MATPRRGLRDLRSMSGKTDRIANPYMAYMHITCLEMEKARRSSERATALHRVQSLDARIREIENEKAGLISALAARAPASEPGATTPERQPTSHRSASGLRIRY